MLVKQQALEPHRIHLDLHTHWNSISLPPHNMTCSQETHTAVSLLTEKQAAQVQQTLVTNAHLWKGRCPKFTQLLLYLLPFRTQPIASEYYTAKLGVATATGHHFAYAKIWKKKQMQNQNYSSLYNENPTLVILFTFFFLACKKVSNRKLTVGWNHSHL